MANTPLKARFLLNLPLCFFCRFVSCPVSGYKIIVFFSTVLTIVVVLGTVMYVLEGEENGFTSIPQGIYWAIVTVTTVGFGDVVPQTVAGKIVSSIAMILGYAIIAVPTGIITVQMSKQSSSQQRCSRCDHELSNKARFCPQCGEKQVVNPTNA